MTTIPLITALPSPAPSSTDPLNFDTRGDALLTALPTMVTEENATIAAINTVSGEINATSAALTAAGLAAAAAANAVAFSTSSLTVNAGTKTVVFTSSAPYFAVVDLVVAIILRSNPTIRMFGSVAPSLPPTSAGVSVTVASAFIGSGTYDDWIIMDAAFLQSGATAAEVRAGTTDAAAVTAKSLMDAGAFAPLTYASTVNWDFDAGFNRYLTLAGNPTMAAPTHPHDGLGCALGIAQTGGGNTVTWNSIFDWGGDGAPTLSTGAGKVDFAFGIYCAATGKFPMTFRRAA